MRSGEWGCRAWQRGSEAEARLPSVPTSCLNRVCVPRPDDGRGWGYVRRPVCAQRKACPSPQPGSDCWEVGCGEGDGLPRLLAEVGGVELLWALGLVQLVLVDLLAVLIEDLAELGMGADGLCVFSVKLDDITWSLLQKTG